MASRPKKPKKAVSVSTFHKWQTEQEKEHKTLSWLRCDKHGNQVTSLWCQIRKKFEHRNHGTKNFSAAWIRGTANQKLSNVTDHAKSDQHQLSMSLLRTEQAKAMNTPVASYAPIARSILTMEKPLKEKMCKKFDICYVLAKENLAFRKYPAIHELESRHDVDLGMSYTTKDSAKSFSYYIAQAQRNNFIKILSSSHFYSFLMDGTTDAGNVEDELIVVMGFKKDDTAHEVGSFARYGVLYYIISSELLSFQLVFLAYSMYTLNRLTIIYHIALYNHYNFPYMCKTFFLLPMCF